MTDLDGLLRDLERMRLTEDEWIDVDVALGALDTRQPDATALSQIVFEARVQQRFHAGRAHSTLPPTKQTSALPWVGLVCAAILLAVGGTLGGGIVLVGVAGLGLFVFAVALAGSRVAHRRPGAGAARGPGGREPSDDPVPMPSSTASRVEGLRRR